VSSSMNVQQMNIVNRTQPIEPWWTAGDREVLAQMRNAVKGQPETAMIRYCGDMRPELVSEVRARIEAKQATILRDIANFIEAGGDYDRM
jgi:hypothetical protein